MIADERFANVGYVDDSPSRDAQKDAKAQSGPMVGQCSYTRGSFLLSHHSACNSPHQLSASTRPSAERQRIRHMLEPAYANIAAGHDVAWHVSLSAQFGTLEKRLVLGTHLYRHAIKSGKSTNFQTFPSCRVMSYVLRALP